MIIVASVEAPINRVLVNLAIVGNRNIVFASRNGLIGVDLQQLKVIIGGERFGEAQGNGDAIVGD